MFCSNCGAEVSGNFCSNCGAPIPGQKTENIPMAMNQESGLSVEDMELIPIFARYITSKKPNVLEMRDTSMAVRKYRKMGMLESNKFVMAKLKNPVFLQEVLNYRQSTDTVEEDTRVSCPRCGSKKIKAKEKGFGFGKAAVGGFLLGPLGLLAGGFGRKKLKLTCENCGYRFDYDDARKS